MDDDSEYFFSHKETFVPQVVNGKLDLTDFVVQKDMLPYFPTGIRVGFDDINKEQRNQTTFFCMKNRKFIDDDLDEVMDFVESLQQLKYIDLSGNLFGNYRFLFFVIKLLNKGIFVNVTDTWIFIQAEKYERLLYLTDDQLSHLIWLPESDKEVERGVSLEKIFSESPRKIKAVENAHENWRLGTPCK